MANTVNATAGDKLSLNLGALGEVTLVVKSDTTIDLRSLADWIQIKLFQIQSQKVLIGDHGVDLATEELRLELESHIEQGTFNKKVVVEVDQESPKQEKVKKMLSYI